MPGLRHSLMIAFARIIKMPDPIKAGLDKGKVPRHEPSSKVIERYQVQQHEFKDHRIFQFGEPKNGDPILYYIHGGGFVLGMVDIYLNTLGDLGCAAEMSLIAPDFPLPPETDAAGVLDYLLNHITQVMTDFPDSPLILAGDSAGANLVLSCAQTLPDDKRSSIKALFPLFGVYDLRKSPKSFVFHKQEILLTFETMERVVSHWVGERSVDDPQISPILGDFSGLPPIHLYSGDKDPLYPDSVDLGAKLKAIEHPHTHKIYKDYGHDFFLLPTPDGKRALQNIGQHIRDC